MRSIMLMLALMDWLSKCRVGSGPRTPGSAAARLDEVDDAKRCFDTFCRIGHQRHADALGAGIDPTHLARQVAAGQHRHVVLSQQLAREAGVAQAQGFGHELLAKYNVTVLPGS